MCLTFYNILIMYEVKVKKIISTQTLSIVVSHRNTTYMPTLRKFLPSYYYGGATVLLSLLVSFQLPILVCFPFPVQSLIYKPISLLFMPNYHTNIFPRVVSRTQCASEGGGGVTWVACRHS